MGKMTTAIKKPTKREDYFETRNMFISKSLIATIVVGIAVVGLLIYFFVWPFLLSHFFVAKFYQEDSELADWSGRVVVFYDKKKTMPMYKGTLEKGVLEGKGTEYDRDGLVTFEGEFAGGIYNGKGVQYRNGIMVYEGNYAGGLYNGKGTLYQDGKINYVGSFADGLFEGLGTLYYPTGTQKYVGSFAGGLSEGAGTEYRQNGSLLYKGSFGSGLYEGEGIYYYTDDSFVKANFNGGVTDGTIAWYQGGRLWYEGGAADLIPDGFGSLYTASGKVVYQGEMDRGTIDGAWLLGLTADEVRDAFGEARVSEKNQNRGFQIANLTLGLTVLCSYQSDSGDASVFKVFFRPDGTDRALLPWQDSNELTQWVMENPEETPSVDGMYGVAVGPNGRMDGEWNQSKYIYEDYFCIVLWANEHGTPFQFSWGSRDNIPAAGIGSGGTAVDEAQARLDGIMDSLDAVESGKSDSASEKAVSGMLEKAGSPADALAIVGALADCYTYSSMATALGSGRTLLEQQLAEGNAALNRGTGSQSDVEQVRQKLDELNRTLAQYETGVKQAKITVQYYCGKEPDPATLQSALVAFDPAKLNASQLCQGAVSYAEALAAGQEKANASELTMKVKTSLLDLNAAYESYTAARSKVNRTAAEMDGKRAAFAKGTVDRAALYDAQCEQNTAVAELCQSVGAFTHRAAELNNLTGGMVSGSMNWMPAVFQGIYQAEVQRAQQTASVAA